MKTITIKNVKGEKEKYNIPTSWNELTLAQFIRIEGADKSNILLLFSIITGLDITIAENSKDEKLEAVIWDSVSFLVNAPDWEKLEAPMLYEISGEMYRVPKDFKQLMIGQKILIGQAVKNIEDLIEKMPRVLAVLFLPLTNGGNFDSNKLDDLAGKITNSLGVEGYTIAKLFFLSSQHLRTYGISGLKRYQQSKTKTSKISRFWLTKKDLNPSKI